MGKAIRIDNHPYDILDRMKERYGKTYGALVGAMILYFERMGTDPEEVLKEDEQILLQIKQQNERILERLNLLNPHQLEKLFGGLLEDRLKGTQIEYVEKKAEKSLNLTSLYQPGLICPRCNANWDSFTAKKARLVCSVCEFAIPMFLGETMLEIFDVFCLLTGSITRPISYTEKGTTKTVRLFWDHQKGLIHLPPTIPF